MCIYAFYLDRKKDIFVMMGNRDEEFKRKSIGLHFINKNTLMGIDLREKGSWLGLTLNGKIAFITNYRNPKLLKKEAISRGNIVKKFLIEEIKINEFIDFLHDTKSNFNGYNLIFGNLINKQLFYYSNIKDKFHEIEDGLHCLSNAFLDSDWPKCKKLKKFLKNIIKTTIEDENIIFSYLEDKTKAENSKLPNTNISKEIEKELSSIFVKINNRYGTIFSYFIKTNHKQVYIVEKNQLNGKLEKFNFTLY